MKRLQLDRKLSILLILLSDAGVAFHGKRPLPRGVFTIEPRYQLFSQLSINNVRRKCFRTFLLHRVNEREEYAKNRMGPFPTMPSPIFISLAQSQFELLANSLYYPSNNYHLESQQNREFDKRQKIRSIALYLPQENSSTGQLEFLPAIVYPFTTTSERIFIASDSESRIPPSIPQTLSKLPGFTHAKNLIPTYPFVSSRYPAADPSVSSSSTTFSSSSVAIGSVEEVMYDSMSSSTNIRMGNAALSLPLYRGDSTLGILLVWPAPPPAPFYSPISHTYYSWTEDDKRQISRAGQSLALALSLDRDRNMYQSQNEQFRVAVSDTLHQIKNPLQALRTFAKLLQRQIAINQSHNKDDKDDAYRRLPNYGFTTTTSTSTNNSTSTKGQASLVESNIHKVQTTMDLMKLADNMVSESARAANLLLPMNDMIDAMETAPSTMPSKSQSLFLPPSSSEKKKRNDVALVPMQQTQVAWVEKEVVQVNPKNDSSWFTRGSKLSMTMTFISDILVPLLQRVKVLASERGIHLEVQGLDAESELPGVFISTQALNEAISNILDNAITYVKMGYCGQTTVQNPSPTVRVCVYPNNQLLGVGVTILIEDNGPGIPSSEHPLIFTRGYRSKRTQHSLGRGIGLDISRALIEKTGGSLDILENGGRTDSLLGAVFQIILYRSPRLKMK